MGANRLAWQVALAVFLLLPLSSSATIERSTLAVNPGALNGRASAPAPEQAAEVVGCLTLPLSQDGAPDRVEVRKNRASSGPVYRLYFIAGWPDSPKVLAEYPGLSPLPPDMFFAGGNLILEWVGGDRPVIQAFHLVKGGAELVFDRGARAGFEYWGSAILRNNAEIGADGNYHNTTTEIWRWDGKQYKLVATIPYGQRLEALAKLEHEAKIK